MRKHNGCLGNGYYDTGSRWSLERLGPRVKGWGGRERVLAA